MKCLIKYLNHELNQFRLSAYFIEYYNFFLFFPYLYYNYTQIFFVID